MLRRVLSAGTVAFLGMIAGGCMAAMNMRDGPGPKWGFVDAVPHQSIYGGVRLDAGLLSEGFGGILTDSSLSPEDRVLDALYLFLFLTDLPLSAIVDTLTLPVTVRATLNRRAAERAQEGPVPKRRDP
jgi:hypothetical protein